MISSQEPQKSDNTIFITGVLCLVLSLGLLLFALYILPFLLWDLSYDVPDFVTNLMAGLQDYYGYSIPTSKFLVWCLFVIPGLITGYISYYISHLLDERKK